MYQRPTKRVGRIRIHKRIRRKIAGSAEQPRLAVFRSLKHIYAQVIDDQSGRTLASAGTNEKALGIGYGGNAAAATLVGKQIGERAAKAGIKQVVFDRGGHLYHGRVKALADAAREAGLEF